MSNIKSRWLKAKRKKAVKYLTTVNPEKLEENCQKALLKAFKRVSDKVPAYRDILNKHHVNIAGIDSVENFKKYVPVIDKTSVFPYYNIHEICLDGSMLPMKTAMSSSGFSGTFSFGINTRKNFKTVEQSIDTSLEYLFKISEKKTLMVSCVPMGVKVHTSIPLAETSVRSDMALAIIEKFMPYFEQLIIVADPHFIKKLLEEGLEKGLNWEKMNTNIVFGEDWFSDSFRRYIESLCGINTRPGNDRMVMATMGIAELDLNLFHESAATVAIRKKAQENELFRKDLFGEGIKTTPTLFHYFTHRTFMEAIPDEKGNNELVFSMLSPNLSIPFIRYNSKDAGNIHPYNKVKEILKKHELESLLPDLKLPMISVGGRNDRYILHKTIKIFPEDIKQGLYENLEVARSITGYFRLSQQKESAYIEVQLNKNIRKNKKLDELIRDYVHKHLDTEIEFKTYEHYDFPHSMELDYEKKFKFI